MKGSEQKMKKTMFLMLLVVALLLAAMTGCDSGTTDSGKSMNGGKGEQGQIAPQKISIMTLLYAAEAPDRDNPVWKKLEQLTNTQLDIAWVPNQPYDDKQRAMVVSGELPQIVMLRSDRDPSNINAMRSGMFWEIGPYLKDYPNLSKLDPRILETSSVDGKVYGIYNYRDITRGGIIFRKDWLDKLKLPVPQTVDDLYQTLHAFTYDDPDGDGKQDTFGTGESKLARMFPDILADFGAPNNWEVGSDGKFTKDVMTKEYMDALNFMKKLYDEKLINQDFAAPSVKPPDYMKKGQTGTMFNFIGDSVGVANSLKNTDPKAVVDVANRIQGPKGARLYANRGYAGIFAFPKTSVKTEADLKRLLAFMDQLGSPEIQNLLNWGIEGLHYKMENNKPIALDQTLKDRDVIPFGQLYFRVGDGAMPNEENPLAVKVKQLQDNGKDVAVFDPSGALISQTDSEKGNQLDQIINDANIKFIMGVINESGWQAEVVRWRKEGGDKIADELAAEYAKAHAGSKK